MTAQRAVETVYTNTTGKPIEVNILLAITGDTTTLLLGQLIVDGIPLYTGGSNGGSGQCAMTAIVPPGSTYKAHVSNGSYFNFAWCELR
jgi:hypothetical protein